MKRFLVYILFNLILFGNSIAFAQINKSVVGKISLIEKDSILTIKAQVKNNESFFMEGLSYNLVALKKSISGNYSTNKQAGEFSLLANEKKNISDIRLNFKGGEEIKAYLFIKKNEILISKDTLLFFVKKNKTAQNKIFTESDFEIKGIIVDDVMTKVGKDFYDYFYQDYSALSSQYSFIINIKEKPYFGRSSIISIVVDDNLIYEFMSQPNEEFLRSAVKTTLQNVSQFAIQRKLLYRYDKY